MFLLGGGGGMDLEHGHGMYMHMRICTLRWKLFRDA